MSKVNIQTIQLSPMPNKAFRDEVKRQREAAEKRHDKLCITLTAPDLDYCWCHCKLCWDSVGSRCICSQCPCRTIRENHILELSQIPRREDLQETGIGRRKRTLYLADDRPRRTVQIGGRLRKEVMGYEGEHPDLNRYVEHRGIAGNNITLGPATRWLPQVSGSRLLSIQ